MDLERKDRALGDFGNKLLLAPYRATAESLLPSATLFGLPNSAFIVFATFEDEDGVSYCLCREMPGYLSAGCWLMSNAGGDGMRLMPESAGFWSGPLAIESEGDRIQVQSADVHRGVEPRLGFTFEGDRVSYREDDIVNVTAIRRTAGYQFYEPTHGQGSTNEVLVAQGTIAGRKVSGWLGLNCHFQKPGINYRISPMVRGGGMVMWFDVANLYDDGSWEQGPILVGRDGFNAAWIENDKGQVTYSMDVEATFETDPDGWATEMRFSWFDARTGEPMRWIWRPKPGSNMVELPGLAPHLRWKRSAEGSCVREGETRKLLHTSAWPDFQPDERLPAYLAERSANRGGFG
jgi:hypothetical protein